MKLREFLKDVDPEQCSSGKFFSYPEREPICPIAHGAAGRGMKKEICVTTFLEENNIPMRVLVAFINCYDKFENVQNKKKEAFEAALVAAELIEGKDFYQGPNTVPMQIVVEPAAVAEPSPVVVEEIKEAVPA